MKRMLRWAVSAALVAAVAPTAEAQTWNWNVCGGKGMTAGAYMCANVTVTQNTATKTLTFNVYNTSGLAGTESDPRWFITGLGLDNVVPSSVTAVAGSLVISGPCVQTVGGVNVMSTCSYSGSNSKWSASTDFGFQGSGGIIDGSKGLINVDLGAWDGTANQAIASSCAGLSNIKTGQFVTSCAGTGVPYTTISFRTTGLVSLDNAALLIRGQGPASTVCYFAPNSDNSNCEPYTPVPEPVTMTLLASGLAGIGVAKRFRRRRDGKVEEV